MSTLWQMCLLLFFAYQHRSLVKSLNKAINDALVAQIKKTLAPKVHKELKSRAEKGAGVVQVKSDTSSDNMHDVYMMFI